MSSMLEQAIIDAAALRETAMKNAEATLIEKYNKEFKDTVQKLLEQEEVTPPQPPPEMSSDTAAANAADPAGPTVTDPQEIPDPMANLGASPVEANKSDVFKNIKSAFFDLDGDDNELITINFDGLTSKPGVDTNMVSAPPAPEAAAPMMESLDLDEEIELELDEAYDEGRHWVSINDKDMGVGDEEEEEEEEELEIDESLEGDQSAIISKKAVAAQRRKEAASAEKDAADAQQRVDTEKAKSGKEVSTSESESSTDYSSLTEEEVELTEEEMNELEESLRVDMAVESEGYMGSHKRKARENTAIAYAEARDDKKAEERKKYAERIKELQESVSKTNKQNDQLISAVRTLKEQLEKTNVSNAKLLYTNKVLSNASLNERQKNNIVENITRAASVLEAKTIYETLQSTVQSVQEKAPKSLSEAINRKQTPFLARKEPTSYNDVMTERMKALAGIKKAN